MEDNRMSKFNDICEAIKIERIETEREYLEYRLSIIETKLNSLAKMMIIMYDGDWLALQHCKDVRKEFTETFENVHKEYYATISYLKDNSKLYGDKK